MSAKAQAFVLNWKKGKVSLAEHIKKLELESI